jgi:L-threonylcarbamoyladenylate synthase
MHLIEAHAPAGHLISEAARMINKGGVVIFPTRCLYGLGADALNPVAIAKVFEIKNRSSDKPLLILIENQELLPRLVKNIPPTAIKLTLVFEALDSLPAALTAGTGKIGIRLPDHPVASALVAQSNHPITGTSANVSDRPGCATVSTIDSSVIQQADLILNAGVLKGGQGSTVVDITVDPPLVLREGAVSAATISLALM